VRSAVRPVEQIKSRSSRLLGQEFPQPRSRLPTLWIDSYFVATVGGATPEVVKRHVENPRNVSGTVLSPMAEARGFSGTF
jgi:putative transposase